MSNDWRRPEDVLVTVGRAQHGHHAGALVDGVTAYFDVAAAPRTQKMMGVEYRMTSSTAVARTAAGSRRYRSIWPGLATNALIPSHSAFLVVSLPARLRMKKNISNSLSGN